MQSSASPHEPEAFLEHLDWVRRLAQTLVADPNLADDIVQEAWISSARRAPRGGHWKAWLARVSHNAACQIHRAETRRSAHEQRAARSEALPSDAELLERVSVQRKVVECVLALDEPYRQTILLPYFEDLPPAGIAERTAVPLATVKSRLRHALDELRTRLDRAHGGDGRAWLSALAPIATTGTGASTTTTGVLIMSTKTLALVIASAGVIALVGYWAWSTRMVESRRLPGVGSVDETADNTSSSFPRESQAAIAPGGSEPSTVERTSVDRPGFRLLVVDGTTGDPVPSVDVWYGSADWSVWSAGETDREVLLHTTGRKLTADASGELVVPDVEGSLAAVCRSGEHYGEIRFEEQAEEPAHLQLFPDQSVSIQVVDASSRSKSGVRVEVILREANGESARWSARTREPDGLATCSHLRQWIPEAFDGRGLPIARIVAVLEKPVEEPVDPARVSAPPIRLVLPEMGRVVVRCVDDEGNPTRNNWVMLTPSSEKGPFHGRKLPKSQGYFVQEGPVVFESVGLRLDLRVQGTAEGFRGTSLACEGPSVVDEEVAVTMRFADPFPVPVGRAMSPAGEALSDQGLSGSLELAGAAVPARHEEFGTGTGHDGSFRVPIKEKKALGSSCRIRMHTVGAAAPSLSADLELHDPIQAGEIRLGDVHFLPAPIVLAGTVRDQSGETVGGAMVDIVRAYEDPEDGAGWKVLPEFHANADETGSFTIRGVLEPGAYSCYAYAGGYARMEPRAIQNGSEGFEIVLQQLGKLEASVLLPEGVEVHRIGVDVRRPNEEWDPRTWIQVRGLLASNGHLVQYEDPGTVDVHFRLDGESSPVLSLLGVAVEAGETTRDPRLREIDLRGLLHPLDIEVVGPSETQVDSAQITFRPTGDASTSPRRIVTVDGALSILSEWPVIDLEVTAPGYRTQRIRSVTGDLRVVLERGIPVRVRLPDDLDRPAPPRALRLAFHSGPLEVARALAFVYSEDGSERKFSWNWSVGGVFSDQGELSLRLPEAGDYVLEWLLTDPGNRNGRDVSLRAAGGQEDFRLDESAEEQLVVLSPDPDDLRNALQE